MTHITYNNPDKLGLAQTIWDFVSQFQVTEEQALAGVHPQRNVSFSPLCSGGEYLSSIARPVAKALLNSFGGWCCLHSQCSPFYLLKDSF
jgi:hypothetical protein